MYDKGDAERADSGEEEGVQQGKALLLLGGILLFTHHLAETLDDGVLGRIIWTILRRNFKDCRNDTLVFIKKIPDLMRAFLCDENHGNLWISYKSSECLFNLCRCCFYLAADT